MAKIDWQAGLKNAMWSMFWMKENHGGGETEADKEALKNAVAELILLTTQKIGEGAKKRGLKNALDWNNVDRVIMTIVCAAAALCLHGEFGDMPETIDGD